MPYEMTQSFYKRTRFSDEKMNLNRPPFIRVKVAADKDNDKDAMKFNIALTGAPVKEKIVPLSSIMNLTPYVNAGNDPRSSQEYSYSKVPMIPPTVLQEIPASEYSYSYGYSLEKKLDEINDQYDKMLDDLSNQYEASLDQVQNNSAVYTQLKNQYKSQLANLKLQHKKDLDQYKKLANIQNNNYKAADRKDIKGCTFTVEVVKTRTSVNQKTTNNPNLKASSDIPRSKAMLTPSSDDEDEDYPQ